MSVLYDICIFKSIFNAYPTFQAGYSFADLVELFSIPVTASEKSKVPLFSPVKLKPGRSIKSGGVEHLSLCVLDVDGYDLNKQLGKTNLSTYCDANDCSCIIYPTYSSFMLNGKLQGGLMYWRVILGFPHLFSLAHEKVAEDLAIPIKTKFKGGVDPACFDRSRRYFLPSIPPETDPNLYKIIVYNSEG